MTTIDLPQEIDERVDQLSAETGFAKPMLLANLWRMGIEDLEDYFLAAMASEDLHTGRDHVVSSSEVRAALSSSLSFHAT